MDWLLAWYFVVFSGLLYAIHEPARPSKKMQSRNKLQQLLDELKNADPIFDDKGDPLYHFVDERKHADAAR